MSSAPLMPLPEERLEQARKEVLSPAVHQQALATAHAAELAVENAAAPSPSKIQEALEGLLPHGQADGEADTAKTNTDAEAKSAAEADATSAAEADATSAAEAALKSEAEAEAAAKSKADANAKAEVEAEAKAKADADAKATDAKATMEAAAKSEAEVEAAAKSKADTDAKAEVEAEAKAKADADAKATDAKAITEAAAKLEAEAEAAAKSKVGAGAAAKSEAEAGTRAEADVKLKKHPSKKVKTQTKGDGGDGSQEEPIAKHLQDIAGADSDESDAVSAGSVKVRKKRKRKEAQIEGETHWQELIAEVTHRMQHDDTLSQTTLDELRKMKEHAEAQLELVKARTQDVDDQADSSTDSDDDKIDVEVRWVQSFSADDGIENKHFPDGSEAWQDAMIKKADLAVTNFLKSPTSKANRIPPKLRWLMRLVAEVVPRCATTSKELALHILTTQQGKIHCRFHEIKRGTKSAKAWDQADVFVGVAYSKAAVPSGSGFLHCGCDEQAALNPKYTGFNRMGRDANNVLTAPQQAFFSQAYSTETLLQINDMYSATYDSVGHMTHLRRVQLEWMLFILNQSLPEDSEWEYALAKKTKIVDGGVPVQ
ncbi:hypothetical protein B0H14DRAFT_2628494 [Mycena olivaceomarginata]|nr:hypothetical protein B0H14DRAFT_2628494 [Mycena olivaceomarginata]